MRNDQDEFFAYAFLDPKNPPKQVMLSNDGTWEHRAYWGNPSFLMAEKILSEGENGPTTRTGKWVRLSVTAKKIGSTHGESKWNGIHAMGWNHLLG